MKRERRREERRKGGECIILCHVIAPQKEGGGDKGYNLQEAHNHMNIIWKLGHALCACVAMDTELGNFSHLTVKS